MSANSWKFLLDENIPKRVQKTLQSKGYEAFRVISKGLGRSPDVTIFSYARANGLIIITQDTDFEDTKHFPPPHPGIFVLRRFKGYSVQDRVNAILKTLEDLEKQDLTNRLIIIFP